MVVTDMTATEIIQNEGLTQVSDKSSVSEIVLKVLMNNPDELGRFRAGKKALFGFFMGEVMKATQGKSDPKITQEVLVEAMKGK